MLCHFVAFIKIAKRLKILLFTFYFFNFVLRILGVDPGLVVTGYGVIEAARGLKLIEAGIIRTKADEGIAERLRKVHQSLTEVVAETKPDVVVIERLYAHYKHPATAILMGHVRGVVCLVSGQQRVPLASVASTHVKKSVTGRGHAGKQQVQRMVQHVLGLKTLPSPSDVADALAVAIAYASKLPLSSRARREAPSRGIQSKSGVGRKKSF